MRHFEQLAGYESVQSQHDVEVGGDATQPKIEYQAEPQQPNSQPIRHTTGPQITRPPLHPNRDETGSNKGKQKQTSWVWRFFIKVPILNVPGEFKTVCGVCKTEYEMHTGWGTGTMVRHLETHDILRIVAYHLIKHKFSGSQGQNPAQVCVSITEKND